VILPKDRDPRFITIRRGGTLTDSDHRLLALWAASCAEHVLHLFESEQPSDPRPRRAIEQIRSWTRGDHGLHVLRPDVLRNPDGDTGVVGSDVGQ
jgi:hypothetical protein